MRGLVMTAAMLAAVAASVPAGPAAADELIGKWALYEEKDAMTDQVTYKAAVTSGDYDAVSVDCVWHDPFGLRVKFVHKPLLTLERGSRTVVYRLDDRPALNLDILYTQQVAMSNTRSGNDVVVFLNGMASATRLRVRLVGDDGSAIDSEYDVTGAKDMLTRLLALCDLK